MCPETRMPIVQLPMARHSDHREGLCQATACGNHLHASADGWTAPTPARRAVCVRFYILEKVKLVVPIRGADYSFKVLKSSHFRFLCATGGARPDLRITQPRPAVCATCASSGGAPSPARSQVRHPSRSTRATQVKGRPKPCEQVSSRYERHAPEDGQSHARTCRVEKGAKYINHTASSSRVPQPRRC